MKFNRTEFIEALKDSKGLISNIAGKLKVSRQTVYNWIDNNPDLRELLEVETGNNLDFVESKLFEQIESGNMTAIIFYLKTKGKHRGYYEKLDFEPPRKILDDDPEAELLTTINGNKKTRTF